MKTQFFKHHDFTQDTVKFATFYPYKTPTGDYIQSETFGETLKDDSGISVIGIKDGNTCHVIFLDFDDFTVSTSGPGYSNAFCHAYVEAVAYAKQMADRYGLPVTIA